MLRKHQYSTVLTIEKRPILSSLASLPLDAYHTIPALPVTT